MRGLQIPTYFSPWLVFYFLFMQAVELAPAYFLI